MNKLEIAIVGAGPAGLAAALFLHRAGHRVSIFERFETPAPVGSGLILQSTGLTVLHALGLFQEVSRLGSRIDRLYGADARTGKTVLDVRYDAQPGGRHGIAVHRAALFGVLHRAVESAGIPIRTSCEIAELDVGSGKATLVASASGLGSFHLIVDATGARSKLRRFAADPAEPIPLPYGAFWASLAWRGDGFAENALLHRYERASVMIGVLPIGRPEPAADRMAAFFWSLKPNTADAIRAAGLSAWKQRVADLWPECGPYLDQVESFDQLTLARYGHHTLKRPAGRRLAIIGDAAHSTSPQLGQGANMALLDAAALAHAVEQASCVEDALHAYARARRMHVRVFQALSYLFTPFYQSDSRFLPFLRDRLVASVARIPPAPRLLASMVAGTMIDPFERIGLREKTWSGPGGLAGGAPDDFR